jgi:hypothetical protein
MNKYQLTYVKIKKKKKKKKKKKPLLLVKTRLCINRPW